MWWDGGGVEVWSGVEVCGGGGGGMQWGGGMWWRYVGEVCGFSLLRRVDIFWGYFKEVQDMFTVRYLWW